MNLQKVRKQSTWRLENQETLPKKAKSFCGTQLPLRQDRYISLTALWWLCGLLGQNHFVWTSQRIPCAQSIWFILSSACILCYGAAQEWGNSSSASPEDHAEQGRTYLRGNPWGHVEYQKWTLSPLLDVQPLNKLRTNMVDTIRGFVFHL